MSKASRGFTLIELLVVIAIIGILSAVVLAALSSGRNKSGDAAVQSDLQSIRAQAEIYYNSNSNTYGTASDCSSAMFADPVMQKAIANANLNSGSTATCYSVPGAYAIQSPLKTGNYWCVDASGQSKKETVALGVNVTKCP